MFKKLTKRNKWIGLIVILGLFVIGATAHASFASAMTDFLGTLLGLIISALGVILTLAIEGLVWISGWQNFIGSNAVSLGWATVRDISNMFFVVVLLIIAFGTILNIPNYNYKKWLPKLILMAILINFSKTICGLLIDVAQVAMLTFVNSFKAIAAANITDILNISGIVTMAKNSSNFDFWTIIGAYFLGIIYLLVAIVVILTMVAVLAMRIVMIWIYVVLSPLAYLLAAFPGGQKYSQNWWSEFTKNLIVGPVLAFFIWLSLAALSTASTLKTQTTNNGQDNMSAIIAQESGMTIATNTPVAVTQSSTPAALIRFVIAIGMLIGGLKISQEIGGQAGSLAGKGMARIQKGASFGMGMAKKGALLPFKGLKAGASYGVDKLHEKTGVDLNLKRSIEGVREKRKEIRAKRYGKGVVKANEAMTEGGRLHGILAMSGNPQDAWEQITNWKGIKPVGIMKRIKGGKRMTANKEEAIADQQKAEHEFEFTDFADKWMNSSVEERKHLASENTEEWSNLQNDKKENEASLKKIDDELATETSKPRSIQDGEKIADLEEQRKQAQQELDMTDKKISFSKERRDFAADAIKQGIDHQYSDEEKKSIAYQKEDARIRSHEAEEKIERNTPEYGFEARATEQKLVSEEASKIKDITDASELLRILKDAIGSHDKTLVKAITLKMTKDANDNEFLRPLVGNTGHHGLKKLMREFSKKGSEHYAGFSQQEAFALGSQIAELNKTTNHWAATAAYTMENGRWRETTDKEHNETRDVETSKQQLQAFIRNNNRLAYGYHDKNNTFHLDAGGVIKLMAIDNEDGHKNIQTMNENAAKYVYDAIKNNSKLKDYFGKANSGSAKSLMAVLEQRLGVIAQHGSQADKLKKANDLGFS